MPEALSRTAVVLAARNVSDKQCVEQFGEALRPLLPTTIFAIGYHSEAGPSSIAAAIDSVIRQGANRVLVVPAALIPGEGGFDSTLARALEPMRSKYPGIPIEYAWPMDLNLTAEFLAVHIRKAAAKAPLDLRSLVTQFVDRKP